MALGDPQAEYHSASMVITGFGAIGLGIVLSLILFAMIKTGIYVVGFSLIVLALYLGPLLIPVGIFMVIAGVIQGGKRVLVFKDGIAEVTRNKTTVMRWDDVDSVLQKVTSRRNRSGKETGRSYRYTVRDKAGQSLILSGTYKNIETLGNTIQTEVSKRLLPKYTGTYNSGGKVDFGQVSVSKAGLSNGSKTIAWSDIEQVALNQGQWVVRQKGQWQSLTTQTAAQTPNLPVMLNLINQTVSENKPKS